MYSMMNGPRTRLSTSAIRLLLVLIGVAVIVTVCLFSLLSMNIMDLTIKSNPSDFSPLRHRIFHLDLKGAPPRPSYYKELFPLLHKLKFTHILMEYEDMFPYSDQLRMLRTKYAYDKDALKDILKLASTNQLQVVPLIQTFGHLEFVLKFPQYAMLREVPAWTDTICPSDERSITLIREMLSQVRALHPDSEIVHIGADEAYQLAKDERCVRRLKTELYNSTDRLKLAHISRIALMAKDVGFGRVWAWNDMFDRIEAPLMRDYNLGQLIVPVVWGYVEDVNAPGYFADGMFERYAEVFDEIIFAGAYKGANGQAETFMHSQRYVANLISYYELYQRKNTLLAGRLSGMILTGWQRYNHNLSLCELLPVSIPVVVKEAMCMKDWSDTQRALDFLDKDYLAILNVNPTVLSSDVLKPIVYNGNIFNSPIETVFRYGNFSGIDLFRKVEELRFLRWKAMVVGFYNEELLAELHNLKTSIKPILDKYFYEDTVSEWIQQNMEAVLPKTKS